MNLLQGVLVFAFVMTSGERRSVFAHQATACNNTEMEFLFATSIVSNGTVRLFVQDGYFEVGNHFRTRTGPHPLPFALSSPLGPSTKILYSDDSGSYLVCDNTHCIQVSSDAHILKSQLKYHDKELAFARFTPFSSKERVPSAEQLTAQLASALQSNITEPVVALGVAFNQLQVFNLVLNNDTLYGLSIEPNVELTYPTSLVITESEQYHLFGEAEQYCVVESFNNQSDLCAPNSIRRGSLFECEDNYATSDESHIPARKIIIVFAMILIIAIVILVLALLNCSGPPIMDSSAKVA